MVLQRKQLISRFYNSQHQLSRIIIQRSYATNQNSTSNNTQSNTSKPDSKMSVPGMDSGAQPGLVSGHAQYVKGVAENVVASVTGSKAWADSGAHDKAQGIQEMKDASASRDPQKQGMGRAEEIAGKMTGCVGMEDEGRESRNLKDK